MGRLYILGITAALFIGTGWLSHYLGFEAGVASTLKDAGRCEANTATAVGSNNEFEKLAKESGAKLAQCEEDRRVDKDGHDRSLEVQQHATKAANDQYEAARRQLETVLNSKDCAVWAAQAACTQ